MILMAQTEPIEQKTPSIIDKITVFTEGAQITRTAHADLPKGKTELVFTELTPNLEPQSIHIKGDGNFTVLSVTHKLNYLQKPIPKDTIAQLTAKKNTLEEKRQVLENQLIVIGKEWAFLDKNTTQIIGIPNNNLKNTDFKDLADDLHNRETQLLQKDFDTKKQLKNTTQEISTINNQLSALGNNSTTTSFSEVHVVVVSPQGSPANFELSYNVLDASWTPTYDLRVTDIVSPLLLKMRATIQQGSGEDWKNIKLTLSTGNPQESAQKPELQPWMLAFYTPPVQYNYRNKNKPRKTPNKPQEQQQDYSNFRRDPNITSVTGTVKDANSGEPILGATIMSKGGNSGAVTDMDGRFTIKIPSNCNILVINYIGYSSQEQPITATNMNIQLSENTQTLNSVVIVSGLKTTQKSRPELPKLEEQKPLILAEKLQQTTQSYEIEQPYTIPTDNKDYTVEIKESTIPATYRYIATPKLDKDAFLTADITNWEQYNLLSGTANLFFEGTYIGNTTLNLNTADDTLHFSLGRDKNVIVTRTKQKDFTSRGFLSGKKTDSRAYEITIRNKKRLPINITIEDQIPLSTNKEIEIENQTTPTAQINETTGKTTWKLEIKPTEEKKLKIQYSVKYPKEQIIRLD
jgi:hypothetical protein